MKRLTGRRTCSKTGQVLNVYFSPPAALDACKKLGGELLQRADDNETTIANRLQVYEGQTAPLIAHYRELGLLKTVGATGEVDDVYGRLTAALGVKKQKSAPAPTKQVAGIGKQKRARATKKAEPRAKKKASRPAKKKAKRPAKKKAIRAAKKKVKRTATKKKRPRATKR
jgi:hypothetical protein